MTIVPRTGSRWQLTSVGFDAWDERVTPWAGRTVEVTQPHGCPRNGTMGHCYVVDAESGQFIGLVLLNSLEET